MIVQDLAKQLINHIEFDIDASDSMTPLASKVVEVFDQQVRSLGEVSTTYAQETRLTAYTFDTQVRCHYYDIDVLRAPSIRGTYKTSGMTALIDAALQGIDDLMKTATLYGDHAFLKYVITDGQENRSNRTATELRNRLLSLPDNWTVAVLVPNERAVADAIRFGFHENNIQMWDARTVEGLQEASRRIQAATQNYFTNRAAGIRSTQSLFTIDTSHLNRKDVAVATTVLPKDDYLLLTVKRKSSAAEFSAYYAGVYINKTVFYQLTKKELVQANKIILLRDKATGDVRTGQTRKLLGLPNYDVDVTPSDFPLYDVFVQSTAPNRALLPDTDVLITRRVLS